MRIDCAFESGNTYMLWFAADFDGTSFGAIILTQPGVPFQIPFPTPEVDYSITDVSHNGFTLHYQFSTFITWGGLYLSIFPSDSFHVTPAEVRSGEKALTTSQFVQMDQDEHSERIQFSFTEGEKYYVYIAVDVDNQGTNLFVLPNPKVIVIPKPLSISYSFAEVQIGSFLLKYKFENYDDQFYGDASLYYLVGKSCPQDDGDIIDGGGLAYGSVKATGAVEDERLIEGNFEAGDSYIICLVLKSSEGHFQRISDGLLTFTVPVQTELHISIPREAITTNQFVFSYDFQNLCNDARLCYSVTDQGTQQNSVDGIISGTDAYFHDCLQVEDPSSNVVIDSDLQAAKPYLLWSTYGCGESYKIASTDVFVIPEEPEETTFKPTTTTKISFVLPTTAAPELSTEMSYTTSGINTHGYTLTYIMHHCVEGAIIFTVVSGEKLSVYDVVRSKGKCARRYNCVDDVQNEDEVSCHLPDSEPHTLYMAVFAKGHAPKMLSNGFSISVPGTPPPNPVGPHRQPAWNLPKPPPQPIHNKRPTILRSNKECEDFAHPKQCHGAANKKGNACRWDHHDSKCDKSNGVIIIPLIGTAPILRRFNQECEDYPPQFCNFAIDIGDMAPCFWDAHDGKCNKREDGFKWRGDGLPPWEMSRHHAACHDDDDDCYSDLVLGKVKPKHTPSVEEEQNEEEEDMEVDSLWWLDMSVFGACAGIIAGGGLGYIFRCLKRRRESYEVDAFFRFVDEQVDLDVMS